MSRYDGYSGLWATYEIIINGKSIKVVAKDSESAKTKAEKNITK